MQYALSVVSLIACAACTGFAGEARDLRPTTVGDLSVKPETWRGVPGFWRVVQASDGRWWFIDPQSKPQVVLAATSVNTSNGSGGRRAKPTEYTASLTREFGADFLEPWGVQTTQRLRDWGFNAAGPWNHPTALRGKGIAEFDIIEFTHECPSLRAYGLHIPDVFAADWDAAAEAWAAKLCTPRRDDPTLIGWFLDNELQWGPGGEEEDTADTVMAAKFAPGALTLLQSALMLPATCAMHVEAWRFVEQRRGGLAGVAKAWGVPLTDHATPRTWTANEQRKVTDEKTGAQLTRTVAVPRKLSSPGFTADSNAFLHHVTLTYLTKTQAVMAKHAPNHLRLGVRFGSEPPLPVRKAFIERPVDVLSFNSYFSAQRFAARLDWFATMQQPLFIGEYSWAMGGRYTGLKPDRIRTYSAQQIEQGTATAKAGATAVMERYLAHPYVVGLAWYRWVDGDSDTKDVAVTFGLVNTDNQPHVHAIEMLRAVLPRLYAAHHDGLTPTPLPKGASAPALQGAVK